LLVLAGGALVATPFWQVVAQWALGMPADSADTWVRIFGAFMVAAGMDPMATYDRLPTEPQHDPLGDARQSARLLMQALGRLRK
jgi:hypothetical protein